MPKWMSTKLEPYGASIFDVIGQKVRAATGVINLGQGFPDFDGPSELMHAAEEAMKAGHNQYAPLPGVPALTHALADSYHRRFGLSFDPATEITVLSGATEAMYAAVTAILEPGDEVIVFAPIYDTYVPLIQMCGGRAIQIPLEPPRFRFDPDRLRAAFGPRTKAVIVNTPHNPSGTVFDSDELGLIRDLCIEHDTIAITDEVYEHLLFDGREHLSLAAMDGMRERTVTISSTGKSFSMTGWKIGWAIAPPEASRAIRRLHQFIQFAVATPLQHAMALAVREADRLLPPLQRDLTEKRQLICRGLSDIGFRVVEPEGTYFVLADISPLSDAVDQEFVIQLIENPEVRVATIPNSVFYADSDDAPTNYIRFCFAKRRATLERGLAQLAGIGG